MTMDPKDSRQASLWLRDQLLGLAAAFAQGAQICQDIANDIEANLDNPGAITNIGPEFRELLNDLKGLVSELEAVVNGGDTR